MEGPTESASGKDWCFFKSVRIGVSSEIIFDNNYRTVHALFMFHPYDENPRLYQERSTGGWEAVRCDHLKIGCTCASKAK